MGGAGRPANSTNVIYCIQLILLVYGCYKNFSDHRSQNKIILTVSVRRHQSTSCRCVYTVGLYRRSIELDVIQPSSAQCTQDRDAMVRIRTATKSATHLNIPSLYRLCDTIHIRSRPRYKIYIDSDAGRHSVVSTGPPAGGHECSGSTRLPAKSLWPYHSATPPPALDSCAAAHILQACRYGI